MYQRLLSRVARRGHPLRVAVSETCVGLEWMNELPVLLLPFSCVSNVLQAYRVSIRGAGIKAEGLRCRFGTLERSFGVVPSTLSC
jgi:hypothetical protein